MRTKLLSSLLFIFVFTQNGCDIGNTTNNDNGNSANNINPAISAKISWSQDVTSINMAAVGVETSEISQNKIYELLPGEGIVYWVSAGKEYSQNINVGNSDNENSDDSIECEQEGEYEGENEGCVFSFSFTGDALTMILQD